MTRNNKNLETLIKVRQLSENLKSNWELLTVSRQKATRMMDEANGIMQRYGTEIGKANFESDFKLMATLKEKVAIELDDFNKMIENKSGKDSKAKYQEFQENTEELSALFAKIGKYPDSSFTEINSADWFNIWAVIQSNIYTVQGVGHSAYIQFQMFEKFNKQEVDELTKEIIKYIPKSYNLEDAIKYKNDYLNALQQMEDEANKKEHLWDRFLNLLAGNIPFKQTPQERVMMMRWVNGEKGEL